MKLILIPAAALALCSCNYTPCDCEVYKKLETISEAEMQGDVSNEYAQIIQEGQELRLKIREQRKVLETMPHTRTMMWKGIGESKAEEPIDPQKIDSKTSTTYTDITLQLDEIAQKVDEACAERGFVTVVFEINESGSVNSFEDIDGNLSGKSDCIHKLLHDKRFASDIGALTVRHTFFVRNPSAIANAAPKTIPTKLPEPMQIKKVLEATQKKADDCAKFGATGDLKLSFQVDTDGKPYKIHIESNSIKNSEAESCILDLLKNSEFPPFPEKNQPPIKYSFKLRN